MNNKQRIAALEAEIRRKEKEEKIDAFDHFVEEAKDAVKKEAITSFGFSHSGQIARLAWWMAAQTIDHIDYLEGAKKGTPEAYDVVRKVRGEANRFIYHLHWLWTLSRTCGGFEQVEVVRKTLTDEGCNKVDDSAEVFRKHTSDKRKKRLHECKKYLKFAVRSLFFFTVGLLLFQFPVALIFGLFFLADILLTD